MADNTSEIAPSRQPLYFPATGRSGIPDQTQVLNKALTNLEDQDTKRRYEFQNDRPGSLGRAFEQRSPWTVKLNIFSDFDDKKKLSAIVKQSRKSKQNIEHIKEHQFREASINRDEELPYRSIVDSENKIAKDSTLYNRDFAENYGKNFYTMQSLKQRQYSMTDGVQKLIGPERPKILKSFRHFHQD